MKKRELAAAVATQTEIDAKTTLRVIDATLDVILATVAKGEDVTLTGFAKMSKVKRAARVGRNPQTGAPLKIKAKTVAKITPLKGFKDVVLGVVPAPKLVKTKVAATAPTKAVSTPAARKAASTRTTTPTATKAATSVATTTKKSSSRPTAKSTPAGKSMASKASVPAQKPAAGRKAAARKS